MRVNEVQSVPRRPKSLTVDRLRELLRYDPMTGIFNSLVKRNRTNIGDVVGSNSGGYLYVSIDYKKYALHQLAFLYMTGRWLDDGLEPEHKNTIKNDNRWDNLRPATRSQNKANVRAYANNTSGLNGVSWDKCRGKWHSCIYVQGVMKNLGRFDCPAVAHFSYVVAADKFFGEFARSR